MTFSLRILLLGLVTFLLLGQNGTSVLPYSLVAGCEPQRLYCLTALNVGRVQTEAVKILKEQSILRMIGQVKITTSVMILAADEAVYHFDTNEIKARGNVRIQLK